MRLAGRVAVITGAGGGIGRALAAAFARRGTHVALCDIDAVALDQTARRLTESGVRVSSHALDVADARAVAALPELIAQEHRGVDLLVNNAGVALGGTFEQIAPEDFAWLFEINFWGVVRMTRAFLPLLHRSDDARIVNMSSIFGIIAPAGQTAYCASKFAVRGFSESLRAELAATNIGVTVVHPGGVTTAIAKNARVPAGTSSETLASMERSWRRFLKLPPKAAAEAIARAVERRRSRVVIGTDAKIAALVERIAPVSYGRILRTLSRRR